MSGAAKSNAIRPSHDIDLRILGEPTTANIEQKGPGKNTIQSQPIAAQEHDAFARRLGFESYLSLFESSTPVPSEREGMWLITALRDREHLLWNVESLQVLGPYSSEADAKLAAQE